MIMSCVLKTSVSTLVEGSPIEIVKPEHGLRQGDPLSPLLFAIVIEYLSRLMKISVNSRHIDLYTSGGIAMESHLIFVDDVAFFCRASAKLLTAKRRY